MEAACYPHTCHVTHPIAISVLSLRLADDRLSTGNAHLVKTNGYNCQPTSLTTTPRSFTKNTSIIWKPVYVHERTNSPSVLNTCTQGVVCDVPTISPVSHAHWRDCWHFSRPTRMSRGGLIDYVTLLVEYHETIIVS